MDGKMTYPEFVWFLLSEEDKKHPRRLSFLAFRSAMHTEDLMKMPYIKFLS